MLLSTIWSGHRTVGFDQTPIDQMLIAAAAIPYRPFIENTIRHLKFLLRHEVQARVHRGGVGRRKAQLCTISKGDFQV